MADMDKSIMDFIRKASEDKSLAERISKAANPDEVYAIAKENGVTVPFDEFKDTMEKLAASANEELSEEEMDAVAGGISFKGVVDHVLDVIWDKLIHQTPGWHG